MKRCILSDCVNLEAIDRLTIQRDAAEALARERTNERDNYGQELDKSAGMVEMYVDDAAAARILWRQSEAACAQMHAQRDAAIARAETSDAAARALGDDFTRVLRECAELKARAEKAEGES